jgi:hypothetical protein
MGTCGLDLLYQPVWWSAIVPYATGPLSACVLRGGKSWVFSCTGMCWLTGLWQELMYSDLRD